MLCPRLGQAWCHEVRNWYIANRLHRYVHTLMDEGYRSSVRMTAADAVRQMRELMRRRRLIQSRMSRKMSIRIDLDT